MAIATAVSQSTSPIHAITQQANGRFWTITQQNEPIGYATLLPLPGLPNLFELTGGVAPQFQRQGAGSFLWQAMRDDLQGTAVHQISHTVDDLDTPAAHFLRHHQFELAHEEWTLQLANLPAAHVAPAKMEAKLNKLDRATAVRTLPTLYNRSFAHTAWHQPYSPDEVASTWQPTDELWTLSNSNKPIGFAWLHFPTPQKAEIEPIGIVKEMQGMGYGRFLLTSLLQTLQTRGFQTVSLGVWASNETAVHLYKSVGFRHVSSNFSLTYTLDQTI
ncbi:MAG: hypothetical protein DHS20C20_25600 [Ardenticatenaceae bacterium]|nr:MAG: hypothetical protein DHS20C20_25600 [Ardenticatenaceae bacterium]